MSTVPSIICNQLSSFINKTGLLPWNENRFLFRNFASEAPYGLLNQSLLSIHKYRLGLQSHLYGTFFQIREFSGRLAPASEGQTTIFYDKVGSEEDNHLALKYYWSFSLAQSNLYQDFKNTEEEYIYRDAREEAGQIIEKGFNKLDTTNPLDSRSYPSQDGYLAESIKKMVELVPINKRENSLISRLAESYILNKAGYKLNHPYSKEDVQQLSRKIRDEPNWTINTYNQGQRVANYLLN